MGKGTAAMGKKSGKRSHMSCRRCGSHAFHLRKKECASCGFGGSAKMRKYSWQSKVGGQKK